MTPGGRTLQFLIDVVSGHVAALAVKTKVAGLNPFGVDEFALSRFKVLLLRADAPADLILHVVVENGADILAELGVIGGLHHHIPTKLESAMALPDHDHLDP